MSVENLPFLHRGISNSTSWSGPLQLSRHACLVQQDSNGENVYNTRRSWARSKRISLGCWEWRAANMGTSRSLRSKSNEDKKPEESGRNEVVSNQEKDVSHAYSYQTYRSKATSGADALLRRLRMRSLIRGRRSRSKTDDDTESLPTIQRSSSTPRPCLLSTNCAEWRDVDSVLKTRSCGSHLNSVSQSELSFKSALETAESNTAVDYSCVDGRKSAGVVEHQTRSFIVQPETCYSGTLRGSCARSHIVGVPYPARPRSSCSSYLYRPLSQPNCRVFAQNSSTFWSSTLPVHSGQSEDATSTCVHSMAVTSVPDHRTAFMLGQPALLPINTYQRIPLTVNVSQSLYNPDPRSNGKPCSTGSVSQHPYNVAYATQYFMQPNTRTQPVDELYASCCPPNLPGVSQSIGRTWVLPSVPPLPHMPQSKSAYSLLTSNPLSGNPSNHSQEGTNDCSMNQAIDLSVKTQRKLHSPCSTNQSPQTATTTDTQENSRNTTKIQSHDGNRPDSLLSGSSLTAESSMTDSLQNSSSSRDSALGGPRPEPLAAESQVAPAPLESNRLHNLQGSSEYTSDSVELPHSMPVIRSFRTRSNPLPPPLSASHNSSHDSQLPPTPRRNVGLNWIIQDMDNNRSPVRVSQQIRAERRHGVYVNAAKCPVHEPNHPSINSRQNVCHAPKPTAWAQLLPYRVSTVPPNLSERLKKSETLPNDVWVYSRDEKNSKSLASGEVNFTHKKIDDNWSNGPRSPPPKPPTRTTSQIPASSGNKEWIPPRSRSSSTQKPVLQRYKVVSAQGARDSVDHSPVLCRYAQLYSLPFHPNSPDSRKSPMTQDHKFLNSGQPPSYTFSGKQSELGVNSTSERLQPAK